MKIRLDLENQKLQLDTPLEAAQVMLVLLEDVGAGLNDLVNCMSEYCSVEDQKRIRGYFGPIMTDLIADVMLPLETAIAAEWPET